MHRFSKFGHQGHWQVAHKPLFMCHLSVSPEPELEKLCIYPKVIQLHLEGPAKIRPKSELLK